MALFKIFKGSSTALGATSATSAANEGFAYFTPDDGKFYIDIANATTATVGVNRIPLNAYQADLATTSLYANHAASSTWSRYAASAGFTQFASSANWANYSGTANWAKLADTAKFAVSAAQATYSASSGYSTSAAQATYSASAGYTLSSGSAGYATSASRATYSASAGWANYSGTANYGKLAGTATWSLDGRHSSCAGYATSASQATYAASAGYTLSSGSAGYATSAARATYSASAGYSLSSASSGYATSAAQATYAASAGSAGYATSASQATHSASANYSLSAGSAGYATSASQTTHAASANYSLSAGSAGYAASAARATYSASSTWANISGSATQAAKVTQNAANTNATAYRVLLSTSGVDTAEVGALNKATNLQYNPSTNTLSTGSLYLAGDIDVIGNAVFENQTTIESLTAEDLIVNASARINGPLYATASNAITAANALIAASAAQAIHSASANYSLSAGSAGYATSAAQATHAASAGYATTADFASQAWLLANHNGSDVSISDSLVNMDVPSLIYDPSFVDHDLKSSDGEPVPGYADYTPTTALVWSQSWFQDGLTFESTPVTKKDDRSGEAITDAGNIAIWLSQSTSQDRLNANMMIDGAIIAEHGFIGNLCGQATEATHSYMSDYANSAVQATHAASANYSASAAQATYAASAGYANYATHANSAAGAIHAASANYATHAASANYATSAAMATQAGKLTNLTLADNVSATDTWRKVWISYNDNATGRPAITDNFVFQTSTNTLKTVNTTLTGNLDVTGNAYLHNQSYIDNAQIGNLIVTGPATLNNTLSVGDRASFAKCINNLLTGTGTAGRDAGAGASPRYFPAVWTFNAGFTPQNGDIFAIKIPVAGHAYGVYLSVNNGANYYPIVCNGTGRLTTHYGVNTQILLMFDSAGSAASMTPKDGAASANGSTISGGVFRVLNYYDANTTYSAMGVAEARGGTATTSRVMRADYLKTFLSTLGGAGLTLTHNTSGIVLKHTNAVTAKTAYGSTSTTATANGGNITVTDIKYDAQGHITGSTDRTITLSNIYWANILATSTASYSTIPEMATIKLNGSTTATSASTKNVILQYDAELEALNFVFS